MTKIQMRSATEADLSETYSIWYESEIVDVDNPPRRAQTRAETDSPNVSLQLAGTHEAVVALLDLGFRVTDVDTACASADASADPTCTTFGESRCRRGGTRWFWRAVGTVAWSCNRAATSSGVDPQGRI